MAEKEEPKIVPKSEKTDIVVPQFLQNLLRKIATQERFSTGFNITSRSASNVGDGFVGVLLGVVISGTRNGAPDQTLELVCKFPPSSEMGQRFAVRLFQREIALYEVFLPALEKFQLEKGINRNNGFFAFPKCYGTHSDEEKCEFAIVLEDLRARGFRMWNKYAPIDYQHVKLVCAELGKFHALSFALRQQRPDLFDEFRSLDSLMFKIMNVFPSSAEYYARNFETAIQAMNPDDEKEIEILKYLQENFKDNLQAAVSASDAEPFTVLCHGDFWNNNIMFQYDSSDSLDPHSVVLIDWQLTQYCSPATDLTYYLCSSTEQPLRTAHFNDILYDYHNSLTNLLERLGGNPDNLFTYEDLQRQLESFGVYGLTLAPILIQLVTVKTDDLPDLSALTENNMKELGYLAKRIPDGFSVRVRDVIRNFVERGYLGQKHDTINKT